MPVGLGQRTRWPTFCWLLIAGACGGAENVAETSTDGGVSVASETGSPETASSLAQEAACKPTCQAKEDAEVTIVEGDGGIARCPGTPLLPNGTDCSGWAAGARCRYPLGDIVTAEGECTCAAMGTAKSWSCSNPPQCGAATCSTGQVCVTRSGGPRMPEDAAPFTPVGACKDWPASCAGPRDCSCQELCGSQPGTFVMCIKNGDGRFGCGFP